MITKEEVQLYIPYAPRDSCKTISRYIKSLYHRRHKYLDESEYDTEVVRILTRASGNYNPRLGHLVRYVKNTLSLKLKDYINRTYQFTYQLNEDMSIEVFAEGIEVQDLTEYTDEVIQAIYNVISGKGNKKDKNLVSELFKVGE